MTTQDSRTYASTLKLKEGLIKYREYLLKQYSLNKNIKVNDVQKEFGLFPMITTWLVEMKHVREYNIEGETGHGKGRRLQWNYKGNIDGTVDQALIDQMIKRNRDYDRDRRANNKLEKEHEQIRAKEEKQILKKLPSNNTSTMQEILVWINEELHKEEQVPGYLRSTQKVMYSRIHGMISSIKEKIQPLKDAIDGLNL